MAIPYALKVLENPMRDITARTVCCVSRWALKAGRA